MLAAVVSLGKEVGKQRVSDIHCLPLPESGKAIYERNKLREEVVGLQAEVKERKKSPEIWSTGKADCFYIPNSKSLKFKRL